MDQLKEVSEWESLGAFLGVKKYKLNDIQVERRGKLSLCKMDLFDQWLRSDVNASWEMVARALESMDGDYNTLAQNVRMRHNLGPGAGNAMQSILMDVHALYMHIMIHACIFKAS